MHPKVKQKSEDIFVVASPTYMENWYEILKDETIESKFIPITNDECKFLITHGEFEFVIKDQKYKNTKYRKEIEINLKQKILPVLKYFDNKAFFRLSSRSPKDSYFFSHSRGLVKTFEDILRHFIDSERMVEDILANFVSKEQVWIVLRKWVEIKKFEEFRLFIINKKLVGISQYYYKTYFKELVENFKYYQDTILEYYNKVKDIIPLENCILDVIFIDKLPKILEINPLYELTDSCLFDWDNDYFEKFEFRYIYKKTDDEKSALLDFFRELEKSK